MKINQTKITNKINEQIFLIQVKELTEKALIKSGLNFILALATEDGDAIVTFKNGMPGNIGATLALQSVKTIAESLRMTTGEMLSDFQRVNQQRDEVEELYNEWKKTKNEERKKELEEQICEILNIDDINKVAEGPREFNHLR